MSFMISVFFMTFFTTFAGRIAIGLPTNASQIEASTIMLTTVGFRGSKDLQRPLVEQPCEDELDPWGCSFYIIFGSKGCNSKKMEKECRYSCNLC